MTTPEEADLEFKMARARKTEADATLAEIEVARLRGSLIAHVDVVAAWQAFLKVMTSRLFAIPTKAGALLAAESSRKQIEAYLETQLRDAIVEVMEYDPVMDPKGRSVMTDLSIEGVEAGTVHSRDRKRVKGVNKDGSPDKRGVKAGSARGPYKKRAPGSSRARKANT